MSGYGLWALVVIDSAVFILFAASFFHPRSRRDWNAMGAFSGFILALFTEMYGFPSRSTCCRGGSATGSRGSR